MDRVWGLTVKMFEVGCWGIIKESLLKNLKEGGR